MGDGQKVLSGWMQRNADLPVQIQRREQLCQPPEPDGPCAHPPWGAAWWWKQVDRQVGRWEVVEGGKGHQEEDRSGWELDETWAL